MWADGHTTVNALWDAFARYAYLPRLKSIDTLVASVRQGANPIAWEVMGFAVADALDASTGRYIGLTTHGDDATVIGTTLVVRPDVATTQLADEASSEETSGANGGSSTGDDGDDGDEPADDMLRRFYAVARLDPERYQRDFAKLAAEVIASLAGLVGTSVEISLEIKATNADGFPEHVTRTVTENARTLKLDSYGFETD
jgi:hypothetical protein